MATAMATADGNGSGDGNGDGNRDGNSNGDFNGNNYSSGNDDVVVMTTDTREGKTVCWISKTIF